MYRETPLEVVCNNHSPASIYEGTCHGQVCIVVLVVNLVLSVLAVLVAICGALSAPMCWLFVL